MSTIQNQKKKILIISYYFPPLGMGGVQRISKFVKYLPSFGWEPVILTVKEIEYFSYDHSLLEELPSEVKIERTGSLDPSRLLFLFKRLLKGEKRGFRNKKTLSSHSSLMRFINLFYFPDNKIDWLPFALIRGIRLCRKEKIDLLFSSSPPLTCHLLGYLLKRITGLRWVADYRDPYLINQGGKKLFSFKNPFLKGLQKLILQNGDGFVGVNQTIAQGLKGMSSEGKNIEVINHGYDKEDFEIRPLKSKDVFKILYFGTFSQDCPAEPFFNALHNLLQHGRLDKNKIRFIYIGLSIGIDIEKLIDAYELKEITEIKGYLPHKKGIEELLKANLALLSVAEFAPVITTGKIYEYFGAQIPILAIVPPKGEAGRLVKSLSAGKVISSTNISEIENALLEYYQEFESGRLVSKINPEELKKFEKEDLTSRLAQVFHRVVNE